MTCLNTSRYFFAFLLAIAVVVLPFFPRPSSVGVARHVSAGQSADGSYDSLVAAVTATQYRIESDGVALTADNPAHDFSARFDTDGALTIRGDGFSSALRVSAFGRGANQVAVDPGHWRSSANRAENTRADIGFTEYVENRPDGLEQGFIVDSKPSGDAPLSLTLATAGGLDACASDDGQKVILKNESGAEVLAYEKLRVWDATGAEMTARMSTTATAITLEVDDAQAVYPLTIDPTFVQRQAFQPLEDPVSNAFGDSVAVSGNTLVVGAPRADFGGGINRGAAYVYVLEGTSWNFKQKLSVAEGASGDMFGSSVAITTDWVVVGAPFRNEPGELRVGAAYVFSRSSNTFPFHSKLSSANLGAESLFGSAVGAAGNTIAVGAKGYGGSGGVERGRVRFFDFAAGVWQESGSFANANVANNQSFGAALRLIGSTMIVGAPKRDVGANTDQGAAYVFTRSGNTWTQQAELLATNANAGDEFGGSVDLSLAVSGAVAVVGARYHSAISNSTAIGAAYVFKRNTFNVWSQLQKLTPTESDDNQFFGTSVGIVSLTGSSIAVGAPGIRSGASAVGKVYTYKFDTSIWTATETVSPAPEVADGEFGSAVAISSNGLFVGAPAVAAINKRGSAFFYRRDGLVPFDFDGDSKYDISVFRPSTGKWWILPSGGGSTQTLTLGVSTDKTVPGDFTGDGKSELAVWRPSEGNWYVMRSENSTVYTFALGTSGDVPTVADFDGDGVSNPAVFRNGVWYIADSVGANVSIINFGTTQDVPIPADFDGDAKADVAIFRPSDASWWYQQSSDGQVKISTFGLGADKPVVGDWTGDGKADIAVFRPSNNTWYFQRSEDNVLKSFQFGTAGDIPVPGDHNQDGRFDPIVFRPSNNTWYLGSSAASGFTSKQFGTSGDRPIPNSFIR